MNSIGLICEYNPFHNGHLYHLESTKKMDEDTVKIIVLGGGFLQRGNMSVLSKWQKAEIALEYGADLVIELPFAFATQSGDIFAKGAISILKNLKVEKLVFGSESNNTEQLINLAKTQIINKNYNDKVKEYLDNGINYPTATSNALKDISSIEISSPNDLLGISYIKEIIKQKAKIKPISIKRTNSYHDKFTSGEISSATSIRELLKDKKEITAFVPIKTNEMLKKYKNNDDNYFEYLKFKIISERHEIKKYQTVDEGLENRIINTIDKCNTLEELINEIKTKRYTHNRISRMLTHILCNFTKEEAQKNKKIKYIRVLGFNKNGKEYLNKIKKDIKIPIITNINKNNRNLLETDIRTEIIYNLINNIDLNIYKEKPIIK